MSIAMLAASPVGGTLGRRFSGVIQGMGHSTFLANLFQFLNEICRTDHCVLFKLEQDKFDAIDSGSLDGSQLANDNATRYLQQQYWQQDPAICQARQIMDQGRQSVIRLDINQLPLDFRSQIYAQARDRVVLCGEHHRLGYCLSMVRTGRSAAFSTEEMSRLAEVGETLISVIAKHAEIRFRRPVMALASLEEIETSIKLDGTLSRREAEVCSRIIYGLSSMGISRDLGIGEETVKTYRTRAYQRLDIGSPRELLMWYLSIWSNCQDVTESLLEAQSASACKAAKSL